LKLVPDNTGRFAQRPHYEQSELDLECEVLVSRFLKLRGDARRIYLTTDELTLLIEQHGGDLDAFADLTPDGPDVEGVTRFPREDRPLVAISERLADPNRENRRRSTLAHEFGHLYFHKPLWDEKYRERLFDMGVVGSSICRRETILGGTGAIDWMEWQAGYVSGAILMPATPVRRVVSEFCCARGWHSAIAVNSDRAGPLITLETDQFMVSQDAARVRLLRLGLLTESDAQPGLF
jgi:hypothetical protein